MLTCEDEQILQDASWAFSYLCEVENAQQMQAIKDSGSLDRLVNLLNHESHNVRHPALRTIGNVVSGDQDDGQMTSYVINLGLLHELQRLMTSDNAKIKREVCKLQMYFMS